MERNIIERYFNNTCTQEEREQVALWLSEQTADEAAKDDITRLWEEFQDADWQPEDGADENIDPAPSFDEVWGRINRVGRIGRHKQPSEKWLYIAAACIGFMVTLGVLLWTNLGSVTSGGDEYITVQTSKGERRWVTLSDGSEVFLNADSRLTYPRTMDLRQAAIYIEGEAFFNMTESDTPRIIKAGGLETWAGERSKFNISAFPSDSTVTVAMDEGKTEIRNGYGPLLKLRMPDEDAGKSKTDSVLPLIKLRPAVVMNQRELAVVHKGRGEMEVSEALNDRKAFGWKDGILYFDAANPPELISRLERWYGVTVDVCKDGLPATTQYSAEFDNLDIANVLAQMSQILSIRYEIVGSTVFLCAK